MAAAKQTIKSAPARDTSTTTISEKNARRPGRLLLIPRF